mmetsp:Transcript_53408/g.119876  ORF Transcript_53408/g.119876 Transcript_53408/m.119876 type:complete len:81 (+) Transcript_53408:1208-1450(+)|eukprot:CAMPEP_0181239012 /NCGR_PEP_ID=MMETSP1096-20121128/39685_1 /TAXON_ID=156174 ORGANISM="Chrysochromulina ericina, Strain CCMP281" /NCGR_SAMPLE_ID=MMETSP1096 /ASSEMBLY_ACC=CAM_ASM_000453 /LENGTH=80 /DNA_ID=CAMNT_0023334637 /DNA_START=47 /DNA_END=289 /DNA_ORIENTATION=-
MALPIVSLICPSPPQMNDLADYEALRRRNVRRAPPMTQALVGDGGFRPAASRQSARHVPPEGCETASDLRTAEGAAATAE